LPTWRFGLIKVVVHPNVFFQSKPSAVLKQHGFERRPLLAEKVLAF